MKANQFDIEDQVKAIKSALQKANSGKAKFIEHEKIVEWLSSWGTEDEAGAYKKIVDFIKYEA